MLQSGNTCCIIIKLTTIIQGWLDDPDHLGHMDQAKYLDDSCLAVSTNNFVVVLLESIGQNNIQL